MPSPLRRIGILAGGGSLPREIADCAARRGQPVAIVALAGEADADFGPHAVTVVNWGQIGRMVRTLKAAGADDLVIVGKVRRPDFMSLRPDAGFVMALAHIAKVVTAGGDDSVLRAVLGFFESRGLHVIGPAEAAPELVIGHGPIGAAAPGQAAGGEVALGFRVIRDLGPLDVGQAVVVAGNQVVAIEGAEGTDAMLLRVARTRAGSAPIRGGILVKRPKPGQEMRVDMPVIGPGTVRHAAGAGLEGIAVLEDQVLAVERPALVATADQAGIFVSGFPDASEGRAGVGHGPTDVAIEKIGGGRLSRRDEQDAVRGSAVVRRLAAFDCGHVAVVARRYVLAVEAGEGVATTLRRARDLRQWGEARIGRRVGVAVLSSGVELSESVVSTAAEAGLSALVLLGGPESRVLPPPVEALAGRLGLVLARAAPPRGGTP